MRILFTLIAVVALTGCETQQRANIPPDPTQACYADSYKAPQFAVLAPKVGDFSTPGYSPTMAMLSDTSYPTLEEKQVIEQWGNVRLQCSEAGRQHRARYAPPRYTAVLESSQQTLIALTQKLYAGELTYGAFNTARLANYNETRTRFDEAKRLDQADAQRVGAAQRAEQRENTAQSLQLMQALQPRPVQQVDTAPRTGMIQFLTSQWRSGPNQMCKYQDGTVLNMGMNLCPLSR